jgi:hypothetical protein
MLFPPALCEDGTDIMHVADETTNVERPAIK